MQADTDLSEWMRAPFSESVARVLYPFAGRYTVHACPTTVAVDPTTRRVMVDPVLVRQLKTPEDLALWVVGARNLLLVRGVLGSRADSVPLRWWEVAWCMAHAASAYNLPRRTCAAMFSPTGSLLDRVLSLQWNSVLETDAPQALLRKIPQAVHSYHAWMNLGEQLKAWLEPPATGHIPLLAEPTVAEFTLDDMPSGRSPGLRWYPVPRVDRPQFRWALDTLTAHERDHVWPKLPSTSALDALKSFAETLDTHTVVYRIGHMGRREVVRHALGIPTVFGRLEVPDTTYDTWSVYLDVSGSMRPYAAIAWSLMQTFPEGSKLYVFSGVVAESDPFATKVLSDGLTSYDAVAQHIVETKAQRVVVVSDDQDSMSHAHMARMEDVYIVSVCIGSDVKRPRTFSDAANERIDLPAT